MRALDNGVGKVDPLGKLVASAPDGVALAKVVPAALVLSSIRIDAKLREPEREHQPGRRRRRSGRRIPSLPPPVRQRYAARREYSSELLLPTVAVLRAGRTPRIDAARLRMAASNDRSNSSSGNRHGRYRRWTLEKKRRDRGSNRSRRIGRQKAPQGRCELLSRIGKEAATTR